MGEGRSAEEGAVFPKRRRDWTAPVPVEDWGPVKLLLLRAALSLCLVLVGGSFSACSSSRQNRDVPDRPTPARPREVARESYYKVASQRVELTIPLGSSKVQTFAIRDLPKAKFAYTLVMDPGGLTPPNGSVQLTFRTPGGGVLSTHSFKLNQLPDLELHRSRGRIESEPLEWARNFDLEVTHSALPRNGSTVFLQLQGTRQDAGLAL